MQCAAHLPLQLSSGQPLSRRLNALGLLLHGGQLRLALRQPACRAWRKQRREQVMELIAKCSSKAFIHGCLRPYPKSVIPAGQR